MAHVNQQIRDAVAATLRANVPALVQVDTNRAPDLIDADLPAGIVSTLTDEVERWSKGTSVEGPTELRMVQLVVVVVAHGESATLDDDMDALRVAIEPLVGPALASIARVATHTGSELDMGSDEDGSEWYAFLSLSWMVEVVTPVGDPETVITR